MAVKCGDVGEVERLRTGFGQRRRGTVIGRCMLHAVGLAVLLASSAGVRSAASVPQPWFVEQFCAALLHFLQSFTAIQSFRELHGRDTR